MNTVFYISDESRDRHYEISFYKDRGIESVWIRNSGGEGMQVNEQAFFELIDKFFKDKF